MKKMQTSIAICAIAILLTAASSCKKDSNSGLSCSSGLICATVDGTNYTADPYNS